MAVIMEKEKVQVQFDRVKKRRAEDGRHRFTRNHFKRVRKMGKPE